MTNYCEECGEEIEEDRDLCEECMNNLAASIINTSGLWPDVDDL